MIYLKNIQAKYIADLISKNNIIGIYQGRSEAGPRALGNRSFLMSPIKKENKDIMNKFKGREMFRPLAASLKQAAHQSIADASMSALDDYNVDPSLVNAYAQLAHQSVQGQGIGKKITKFVRSPAVKTVRKALRPLAQKAFEDAQDVASAGLDLAKQQALAGMSAPSGQGLCRGGALFPAGGALFPAGYRY